MKARLYGSLILGAIAAVIVVAWSGTSNHAKLAAEAAKNHTTVASTLAAGFIIVALVVAVIVFVVSLLLLGTPRGRPGYSTQRKTRPYAGTRR